MTPVLKVAGGQPVWTRDSILEYLSDYVAVYGDEPMTAACFSPSSAKWGDREELIERYYAGNPRKGGHAWPSLNSIKAITEHGSFNEARALIGLSPNRPGPKRRKAGTHRPVRDVRERVHTRVVERYADPRWGASVAEPKPTKTKTTTKVERVLVPAPGDAKLRKAVERAETRLATATERLRDAREKARTHREAAAERGRDAKAAERRLRLVEATLAGVRSRISELGRELHASQTAHTRDTEKLSVMLMHEETERRTAGDRVAERDSMIAELEHTVDDLQARLELADPAELARAAAEVEAARGKVAAATEAKRTAEQLASTAARERRAAEACAERAERVAADETAQRVRIQKAVAGHTKPLSAAAIEALREKGPQGPVIFGDAVKAVVGAQSKGERQKLREALRAAAAAAIGWSDRL